MPWSCCLVCWLCRLTFFDKMSDWRSNTLFSQSSLLSWVKIIALAGLKLALIFPGSVECRHTVKAPSNRPRQIHNINISYIHPPPHSLSFVISTDNPNQIPAMCGGLIMSNDCWTANQSANCHANQRLFPQYHSLLGPGFAFWLRASYFTGAIAFVVSLFLMFRGLFEIRLGHWVRTFTTNCGPSYFLFSRWELTETWVSTFSTCQR